MKRHSTRGFRGVIRKSSTSGWERPAIVWNLGRLGGRLRHDLRHECCAVVADSGGHIHEIREHARHGDIRTTQRHRSSTAGRDV